MNVISSVKPAEFIGLGSIKELNHILNACQVSSVFLVTGKNSFEKSGARTELDSILSKYEVTRFFDFTENPKLEEALEGVDLFLKKKHDLIIAIGGGSVIDMAKLINVFTTHNDVKPETFVVKKVNFRKKLYPLIAIPTTAGTGSEVTHFAVVYIDEVKYSLSHEEILPGSVIIDPELTYNLPPKITATSGLDALCQAIESYWNVNATKESRMYALDAIKLVFENLQSAVNEPREESRIAMAKAAYLAGKAINITKTTAPHAFSYYLTSKHGISHGHAVALWMPLFLAINLAFLDEEIADLLKKHITDDYENGFKLFVESIGLESSLLNIIEKHQVNVEEMLKSVNTERLKNNPVEVDIDYLQNRLLR